MASAEIYMKKLGGCWAGCLAMCSLKKKYCQAQIKNAGDGKISNTPTTQPMWQFNGGQGVLYGKEKYL